jgi:hypothetical protein
MRAPVSVILRIYRREAGSVSGVLEDPQTGARRAFASVEDLCRLIEAIAPHPAGTANNPSVQQPKEIE